MMSAHVPLESTDLSEQEEAWEEYRSAAIRAQETLAFADGVTAGNAWAKFLKLFVDRDTDGTS